LPASYILVVMAIHLVVHELIGVHKPNPTQGHHKNLYKMRALNVTSNPLEWLLALRQGISPRTPQKSLRVATNNHQLMPRLFKLLQAI
jgi:hypothetical protein